MSGVIFELPHWPLFFGHGIVPTAQTGLRAANLKVLPDPEIVHVHGQAVQDGRLCVVLRTYPHGPGKSFDEIWVDQERGCAVLRLVFFTGGRPGTEIQVQYKETAKGWLPGSWVYRKPHPTKRNELRGIQQIQVDKIEIDPDTSDADFQIVPQPGDRLTEYIHKAPTPGKPAKRDKSEVFMIQPDGQRLPIDPKSGKPIAEFRRAWLIAAGLAALGVLAGAAWWVRRRWMTRLGTKP